MWNTNRFSDLFGNPHFLGSFNAARQRPKGEDLDSCPDRQRTPCFRNRDSLVTRSLIKVAIEKPLLTSRHITRDTLMNLTFSFWRGGEDAFFHENAASSSGIDAKILGESRSQEQLDFLECIENHGRKLYIRFIYATDLVE